MLVDTDVLIWPLRGFRQATEKLDSYSTLIISAVTYMELLQRLRNKAEMKALQQSLEMRHTQRMPLTAQVDGVVGNSSSGLTEVPSFKKGTINIGDRQRGSLQAESVINCQPNRKSIAAALEQLYSTDFQTSLHQVINPYGEGGASEKIVNLLKHTAIAGIVKKTFYDLSINSHDGLK